MPDPLLYLKAMAASAIVSAFVVLAVAGLRRPASELRLRLASVLAITIGLAIGFGVLSLHMAWPPKNALDRLLLVLVPLAILIELIAAFFRVRRRGIWFLRVSHALAVPHILLLGSVYLRDAHDNGTLLQLRLAVIAGGLLLVFVWFVIVWLAERSPSVAIPISVALATQTAGIAIMLGGYIQGGAAVIPFAAAIAGTCVASAIATRLLHKSKFVNSPAVLGIGVVGLYGLLFIGRFFGRLSTESSLVILVAPLLCWVAEIPFVKQHKRWLVESLRIALVAIPLIVVLVLAKRDFDQKMRPLLRSSPSLPQEMVGRISRFVPMYS